MIRRFAPTALAIFLASRAWSMEPIPGEERFAAIMPARNSAGAEVGFAGIEEDFFLQLTIKSELNLGKVGLGFQIPLNLRIWDRDPKAQGDYYGYIRREDWDELSEYLKVIRYVRYGHKRDDLYLRVGELAAELGHGTIMSRYLNNMDINTFRVGMQLDVNTNYGGVETVVGDYGTLIDRESPESRVYGARVYVKPLALVDPESTLNILAIGASMVTDQNAPRTIATDATGARQVDGEGNLVVADTTAATVYGFDAEIELLHTPVLDVVPYSDFNKIQQAGWGWHLGTLITAKMPIGIDLTIPLRVEYRRFAANYRPMYFSTFYEVERYQYPLIDDGTAATPGPKARVVRQLDGGEGLNGYYADLAFDFANIFQLGAFYEDYAGGNPNLQAFLSVPALDVVQFKAFYARNNIDGTNDIFKLDDKSFLVAEGRYELVSFVYLVGRWTRRFVLNPETGDYDPDDAWKFGVEASLDF